MYVEIAAIILAKITGTFRMLLAMLYEASAAIRLGRKSRCRA